MENFVSKVGQHIEIMKLEEFGNSLFIDSELQVAEKDEKKYNSIHKRILNENLSELQSKLNEIGVSLSWEETSF